MTGFADQRERASGLEALISDVISKPFSVAEIRFAVAAALAKGKRDRGGRGALQGASRVRASIRKHDRLRHQLHRRVAHRRRAQRAASRDDHGRAVRTRRAMRHSVVARGAVRSHLASGSHGPALHLATGRRRHHHRRAVRAAGIHTVPEQSVCRRHRFRQDHPIAADGAGAARRVFHHARSACRGRDRLSRHAPDLHRRRRPPGDLDDTPSRRLHRRTDRRHRGGGEAAGAPHRDQGAAADRRQSARHLCRPSSRRAHPGRSDQAWTHRNHPLGDLAIRHAGLHRHGRPDAAERAGRPAQQLFRLPGAGDRQAWRRRAEVHRRRPAGDLSDCRWRRQHEPGSARTR